METTPSAPLGYEVPIRLGTWQRPQSFGAPRMYAYSWIIACIWLGLLALMKLGLSWAIVAGGVWLCGQLALMGLTYWNVNWDSALLARLRRKYQPYYRAG
jgi:hypothetical protein